MLQSLVQFQSMAALSHSEVNAIFSKLGYCFLARPCFLVDFETLYTIQD